MKRIAIPGLLRFCAIYLGLAVVINFTIYKLMEDSTTTISATTTTVTATTVTNQEMSPAQIQMQINDLLGQIAVLQNRMSVIQGNADGAFCSFSRDLVVGASGDDVACLQAYLIATLPTYKGVGWPADLAVTGYFDRVTQGALATWQAYHGLVPADGYFDMGSMVTYSHLTRGPMG